MLQHIQIGVTLAKRVCRICNLCMNLDNECKLTEFGKFSLRLRMFYNKGGNALELKRWESICELLS